MTSVPVSTRPWGADPVTVCGLPVDPLTMQQSLDAAEQLIANGVPQQHVVVNAAKIVAAHDDPALAEIISSCALINADGQSVVWASRLLGRPLPERVAGIDFMLELWRLSSVRGYRVFLLGATRDVVQAVRRTAEAQGVVVVGAQDGFWTAETEGALIEEVRAASPDILFLAIPSPRKEFWLRDKLETLRVPLVVGVGGSFDVVAGKVSRAPVLMQRMGLEWLHRLLREPRRMFRRYLVGNTRFVMLCLRYRFLGNSRARGR